jgi:oligosaccharide reducing-end xylanase
MYLKMIRTIVRSISLKRVNDLLLIAVVLIAGHAGYSRTIDPNYEVGIWPGFRQAAVSYTFDDGCSNQFAKAIPMFNEFSFKLTLFTVTGWSPNWTALKKAAAQGHEVASHTVTHPYLNQLTIAKQTTELENSQNVINAHIPGEQCITLAYPYCVPGNQALCEQYYIAARHCQGFIEASTPGDFMNISSIILGNQGVNTTAGIIAKEEAAAASKGWCVFLLHGIDGDGGWSPLSSTILRESLQYLNSHRSTYWVATFVDVVRYVRERNAVSITESSQQNTRMTLQVTDTLDNMVYNYPVTIRRPLPQDWSSAYVLQAGRMVDACVVEVDSQKYIMFNVVPDSGDVVLSRGPYGDFTGNDIVEIEDLFSFLNLWLVDDCNETTGVDLDEDCIVNFQEFTALAENWLQAPSLSEEDKTKQ